MNVRFVLLIIFLTIITVFCGFNLGEANRCDVNLVFHTFHNVPAFMTALTAFLLGAIVTFPFSLTHKGKKADKKQAVTEKSSTKTAKPEQAEKKDAEQNNKPQKGFFNKIFPVKEKSDPQKTDTQEIVKNDVKSEESDSQKIDFNNF